MVYVLVSIFYLFTVFIKSFFFCIFSSQKQKTHAANHMGGQTRVTPLCERRKGTHAPKIEAHRATERGGGAGFKSSALIGRHCIVATSVPSETVFSKTGQIITEMRNRIININRNRSPSELRHLIFLNSNLH